MTDIDTIPASPEMDELVAQEVMGWTWVTFPDGALPEVKHWSPPSKPTKALPDYSTDIAAAWLVVDRIGKAGFELHRNAFEVSPRELWGCLFRPDGDKWAHAPTAPLAICRAALMAVDAEGAT